MWAFVLHLVAAVAAPLLLLWFFEAAAQSRGSAAAPAAKPDTVSATASPAAATPRPCESSDGAAQRTDASLPPAATAPTADPAKRVETTNTAVNSNRAPPDALKILIAYASNSQNTLTLSHKLFNTLTAHFAAAASSPASASAPADRPMPRIKILELREEEGNACSVDLLLNADPASATYYPVVIFLASTFTDGTAPPRSQCFAQLLRDSYEDHRVARDVLAKKHFALFGLGDVAYGEKNFNRFAKDLYAYCRGLGAPHFVVPPVYATDAKAGGLSQVFAQALIGWLGRVQCQPDGSIVVSKKATAQRAQNRVVAQAAKERRRAARAEKQAAAAALLAPRAEGDAPCDCTSAHASGDGSNSSSGSSNDSGDSDDASETDLEEIEELVGGDGMEPDESGSRAPPELIYPRLRANLEKQGYGLIGSHSGVKLCRWTKAMLRGRGGCYKHTFYNINSSQCMELTPSLACANKCVFCWRHHTNPVSTTFRWKVDDPLSIVEGGIARHVKMMRTMAGVPGVTEENLRAALTVKHCALSLVGEPIMYPRINEFVSLLHAKERQISSFMVTNAQFPEQLQQLRPVTQLYLSIDAPTPQELKAIDRPLFEDYWERCLRCVEVLRHKRNTRTVFRLTLVNEMNSTNIANYADLVEKGWPDFVEVKGVTYCGTSNTNSINMKTNVPRHDEVIDFCARLCDEIARRRPNYVTTEMNAAAEEALTADEQTSRAAEHDDTVIIPAEERNRPYHIACEHEHSCCVLVALDKFYFQKRWNVWIDYAKFFELAERYERENGAPANPLDAAAASPSSSTVAAAPQTEHFSFTALDYCAPTPSWAVYRSAEKGFDPAQTRVIRKKARPVGPTTAARTGAAE